MFIPFSDSAGKTGLVEDVDFLCGTDSTSYPTADKTRNINRHYYETVVQILKSAGRLQFDDINQTTLPVSTFTLVTTQADYALPTDWLQVQAIEIKDAAGNWQRLQPIDINDPDLTTTITDYLKTNGMPRYYDLKGNSMILYPAPLTGSVTLSSGGKIHYAREVDAFLSSDTTQEPGFSEPFHRLLSLGAAHDYLLVNGPTEKADRVLGEYTRLRSQIPGFFTSKSDDERTAIRPYRMNYL